MAPMAPMMPAMPTPAAVSCWEAPEDWEAEPPVVAEPVEDAPAEVLPPLGELAPPEVVGVEPPEVLVPAGALVVAAPVDWAPEVTPVAVSVTEVFTQLEPPSPTLTAADWTMLPVVSFRLQMKLVPPGTSTFQVKPVPEMPSNSLSVAPPVVVP